MPFDLSTAKPVPLATRGKFDLSTARPVEIPGTPSSAPTPWNRFGELRPAPLGPPLADYPATAAQFVNTLLGGLPRAVGEMGQRNLSMVSSPDADRIGGGLAPIARGVYGTMAEIGKPFQAEPASIPGKILSMGGILGAPGQAGARIGEALTEHLPALTESAMGRAALRAAQGGVTGAVSDVSRPEQLPGRAMGFAAAEAAVPAVLNKAFKLFAKTPPGKLLSDAEFEQLAGKVRQAVGGGKLSAGIAFDRGITDAVNAKPEVATPILDFMDALKDSMKADSRFAEKVQQGLYRSAKQGNTTLQAMLGNPSLGVSATGRDLQNIKQTLQSVPSVDRALQRTYALQGLPRPGRFDASVSEADLALIDHISDLRGRLLSAYPELQSQYDAYSQFMQDYRTLAPQLRTGSIESALLDKYGNPLQRQAASRILPSEIIQQVEQVRERQRQVLAQMEQNKEFHTLLKKMGYAAVGGTIGTIAGASAIRLFIKALVNRE